MKTLKLLLIFWLLAVFTQAADVELDFDFDDEIVDLEAPIPKVNKNTASNFDEPEIETKAILLQRFVPKNAHDNNVNICNGKYETCDFSKNAIFELFIHLTLSNITY